MMPAALTFFLNTVFCAHGPLWLHMDFRLIISICMKNTIEILVEIALNLQIAFNSMDILTIVSLLVLKCVMSFHLFMLSLFSAVLCNFQYKVLCFLQLSLSLSALFFLMLSQIECFLKFFFFFFWLLMCGVCLFLNLRTTEQMR